MVRSDFLLRHFESPCRQRRLFEPLPLSEQLQSNLTLLAKLEVMPGLKSWWWRDGDFLCCANQFDPSPFNPLLLS